jgi:hypothetical protein
MNTIILLLLCLVCFAFALLILLFLQNLYSIFQNKRRIAHITRLLFAQEYIDNDTMLKEIVRIA